MDALDDTRRRRPRVVVAGQLPPPPSGQHVAVAALLESLREDGRFDVEHLRYGFASTMEDQGALRLRKLIELARIMVRLVAMRARGPIDVLVHPVGGTSAGSTVRDIAVLSVARPLSRRIVLQFHGGGHGRTWPGDRRYLVRVARRVLGSADAAVVHAKVNAIDAEIFDIGRVYVAPHQLADHFDAEVVDRDDDEVRLLYMGHLGPHRGTPQLLEAVRALRNDSGPALRLQLAGSPVGAYSHADLAADIERLGLGGAVDVLGNVSGRAKDELFGRAHLFVFPSVFEAESFGLVLAEALMWGLPVVATDWRANAEVLAGADAIVHPYAPDLAPEIGRALREAIARLESGTWSTMSTRNRAVYEARYSLGGAPSPAAAAIASLVGVDCG